MERDCLQVKVRSVGAHGAGHSPWSEPVTVTVPGRLEAPPPPPSVPASDALEAPKRRRKKVANDRELEHADPKRSECPFMLLQSSPCAAFKSGTLVCAEHYDRIYM